MARYALPVVLALAMCALAGPGEAQTMKGVTPSGPAQHWNGDPARASVPAARLRQTGHSRRFLTAEKLARGIRTLCRQGAGGCALQGQAFTIEAVGFRERISPGFMVAASFTESSGGASPCCGQSMDIWGWYYAPHFTDWKDAFTKYARFIHSRWPTARTAWDLVGYCACGTAAWGNRTSYWMARMGFGGGRLAYP